MTQRFNLTVLLLSFFILGACGPDTIFLRPALDTPAQHVKNGHLLLARDKVEAANTEFVRARSLDSGYAPAYVGLALVQGHRGDLEGGFEMLNQARGLAVTPEESKAVEQGYEQLERMRSHLHD